MPEKDFSPLPRHRGNPNIDEQGQLFEGATYGPSIEDQWKQEMRGEYGDSLGIELTRETSLPNLPLSGLTGQDPDLFHD